MKLLIEMELVFLGTASAYPTPTRAVSCIALRNEKSVWLFDCGEGSQIQLMKSSLKPGKVSHVFITHLHGDHLFGLPGLLCSISQNFSPLNKEPIHIFGPSGIREYLLSALGLSHAVLQYSFIVHELMTISEQYPPDWEGWRCPSQSASELPSKKRLKIDVEDTSHPNELKGEQLYPDDNQIWHVYEDNLMTVTASWLEHTVPSFGYVIKQKSSPGKLDAKKLKDLGVPPGPLYAEIKSGKQITLEDGRQINPSDVMGPDKQGRKIVILGDTAHSSKISREAMEADVLVHECTLDNSLEDLAKERGHSSAGMAGRFAKSIEAKKLILTHFSQRFKPLSAVEKEDEESSDVQILIDQAMEAFGSDEVIAAEDLMSVKLPIKR